MFDSLDIQTQEDYQKLKQLEEEQLAHEIFFPDSAEEVGITEETFEKYKLAFNK
ncbi:hypothetical protein ACO2FA_13210 [Staphylococcus warneri]